MDNALAEKLSALFEAHRVVFWYDAAREFESRLDAIPPDVTLIRAAEFNDFAIKYRILSEEPGGKFLVYFERDEGPDEDNWLLDIQLANAVFRQDRASLTLEELGLPQSFAGLVKRHEAFFADEKLKKSASRLLRADMTEAAFERALLSAMAGEESWHLEAVIDKLAAECAAGGKKLCEAIAACNLDSALWDAIANEYGYRRDNPSIEDFCISVFESSLDRFEGNEEKLYPAARALLRHWKDSKRFRGAFEALSGMAAGALSPQNAVYSASMDELSSFDDYRFAEEAILARLAEAVLAQTMSLEAIRQAAEKRRSSAWFSSYEDAYNCLVQAKALLDGVREFSLQIKGEIESPESGIMKYVEEWSRIDSAYRRFKYLFKASGLAGHPFDEVNDKVEGAYTSGFLMPLSEKWTAQAKRMLDSGWKACGIQPQRIFFHYYIKNLINRGCKAVAVISDALRYEIGKELADAINSSPRQIKAQVSPLLAAAPTYTQLGMAALLPHQSLVMSADGGTVFADGMSTQGTAAREKVLKNATGGKAACIDAPSLLAMKKDALKSLIGENAVIYVYHDLIDREGEHGLFRAAHDAVGELEDIANKLSACGADTIYVTADHGFIFQEGELDPHQYISDSTVRGRDVRQVSGRRCAVGYALEPSQSLMIASLASIGLSNNDGLEAAFPNSMLRMRVHGAATNFVHGGLSLQEIVIPLVKIERLRKDEVRDVQLEVLTSLKAITTASVTVAFYQKEPVSEKARGFDAEFAFYSQDNTAISDKERRAVASDEADPKKRQFSIEFKFNKAAEKYNRQPVSLRICKVLANNRRNTVLEKECMLSRPMGLDFDFDET